MSGHKLPVRLINSMNRCAYYSSLKNNGVCMCMHACTRVCVGGWVVGVRVRVGVHACMFVYDVRPTDRYDTWSII